MPEYSEIPDVGLYLEQVTKYVNGVIEPLGCPVITPSMISNYVKQGVVSAPQKKLYGRDHIVYFIFIGIAKTVVSIDDVAMLYRKQRELYDVPTAYKYFCDEFYNMLMYISGMQDTVELVGITESKLKTTLRSVIMAAANIVFVKNSLAILRESNDEVKIDTQ
ncbi:MAG: DUF1836 domain-containing protein [Clostridia bacterium]|nr:DUF1836 domain-containing protein [Clostridia bacterium]